MTVVCCQPKRDNLEHLLKKFTLVSSIKILVDENDFGTQLKLSMLEIKQFYESSVTIKDLPKEENIAAISGGYHIISSRKAVRKLKRKDLEYVKSYRKYLNYNLQILISGELPNVKSNISLSKMSTLEYVKFQKKNIVNGQQVFELSNCILNGTDLLEIIEVLVSYIIIFKGEIVGFKECEGELIEEEGKELELNYEYQEADE